MVNLTFVEGFIKARDDLDRLAVSEVMNSIKRRVKEDSIPYHWHECDRISVVNHCLDNLLSQLLLSQLENHDPEYVYTFPPPGCIIEMPTSTSHCLASSSPPDIVY